LQVTAVFLPIAHAVLIATYVAMFSSDKTGFVGALAGVATLALMAKLPGWAAGAAMGLDGGDVTRRVYRGHVLTRRVVRTVAAAKTGGASEVARTATGVALRSQATEGPPEERDPRRVVGRGCSTWLTCGFSSA
jgi:TctA family transporter